MEKRKQKEIITALSEKFPGLQTTTRQGIYNSRLRFE